MGFFLVALAAAGAFLFLRFAATSIDATGAAGQGKQLEAAAIDATFEKRLDAVLADGAFVAVFEKLMGSKMPPSAVAQMRAEALSRWMNGDAHDVAEGGAELRTMAMLMAKDGVASTSVEKVRALTLSSRDKVQMLSGQGADVDNIYALIDKSSMMTNESYPAEVAPILARIDEAALVPFYAVVSDPTVTATVPYKCRTGIDCKVDAKGVRTRPIPVVKAKFSKRMAEGAIAWNGDGAVSVVRFVEPVAGEGKIAAFSYVGIVTSSPADGSLPIGQHIFVFAEAPFAGVS